MPHGKPDWGIDWTPRTVWGLEDLGEHAVRLGSPHLWDRRGDVIYLSAFDNGLEGAWLDTAGPGSQVRLWTGQSRQGPYCVRLDADNDATAHASLEWYLPFPVGSGMGIEFSFYEIREGGWWYATIEARDQRGWYEGRIRVNTLLAEVEYYDATGNWIPLVDGAEYWARIGAWHTLKLVTMFDLGVYNRMILDDIVYDMGILPLYALGGIGSKYLHVVIGLIGFDEGDAAGRVDNVIVTQNEP